MGARAPRAPRAGVAVRRQARQWDAEGQEAAANFHARQGRVGGRSRGQQAQRRGSVARDARNRRQPLKRCVADSLNNRWSLMLQRRGPDGSNLLRRCYHRVKLPIHALSTKTAAAEPPVPDRCPHRPRALVQPDRRKAGRAHRAARAGSRAPRRAGGCDGGSDGAGSNLHAGSGGGRAHDAGSGGVGQHHGGGGERRSGGHGH
uniref:Uncharacterized protein n=1 Tax=Triticum urartu TaxID=4572 RepID=A0A8R7PS73_TRIUA